MLTIQAYQPKNNMSFTCKPKNINELSKVSQTLIKDVADLSSKRNGICRSRRFTDGSFLEVQKDNSRKTLQLKLLRMNQRPVEMNIKPDGAIECTPKKQGLDINNIIEKYFLDIIEKAQI